MKFPTSEEGSPRRDLALLAVGFGLLFFQFLGRIPLIDPDEGRYAEIPREMLERGDFVTPTLNYVKYFEKPPLHYWLNAVSLSVFGESEFAARFAGTLCGLLTVLLAYHLGRTLSGRRTGLFAATVLGSATGFLLQARMNFTDMTLTCCLSAAFAFFILAARDGARHKVRDYYLFYVSMALAVLAKGLIGVVLPGAVIFLYLAATGRWRILKEMRLKSGLLLFLLLCAPWFVLVSLRNPEFPHFFFVHEHFQRFLTKVHHRYKPFWFFVPVLAATMLPWSFFIPAAVAKGWRERKGDAGSLFLLLWAGVIFAFFSASGSKLVPYILPVFPPLAILVGNWFAQPSLSRGAARPGVATGALLVIAGAAGMLFPHLLPQGLITERTAAVAGGLFAAQGIVAIAAALKGSPRCLFVSLAAGASAVALLAAPLVYGDLALQRSAKGLARAISAHAGKDTTVACFGSYQQGIAFYTRRRVIVAGDPDELSFGSSQGNNAQWFMDKAAFMRLWDSPRKLLVVVGERELPVFRLLAQNPPTTLAVAGNRVLIANHPAGVVSSAQQADSGTVK